MICWLRPDGVRDGIWRIARLPLPGERSIEGEGRAGGGCGVGVPAGESLGDSSELMSILTAMGRTTILLLFTQHATGSIVFGDVYVHSRNREGYFGHGRKLQLLHVANGMGRGAGKTLQHGASQPHVEPERRERWEVGWGMRRDGG